MNQETTAYPLPTPQPKRKIPYWLIGLLIATGLAFWYWHKPAATHPLPEANFDRIIGLTKAKKELLSKIKIDNPSPVDQDSPAEQTIKAYVSYQEGVTRSESGDIKIKQKEIHYKTPLSSQQPHFIAKPAQVILLSGPKKTGKTILALSVAAKLDIPKKNTHWMHADEINKLPRFIRQIGQKTQSVAAGRKLDDNDTTPLGVIVVKNLSGPKSLLNGINFKDLISPKTLDLREISKYPHLRVIVTTHDEKNLPEDLKKLFDEVVRTTWPKQEDRQQFLATYLQHSGDIAPEILEQISNQTIWFTIPDLESMADKAARTAATAKSLDIKPEHFEKAISEIRNAFQDPFRKTEPQKVTFDQVILSEDIKDEMKLVVSYLNNEQKNQNSPASKGYLLVGPPGTGKTHLAKAIASTSGVPLIACSGSDFTAQMYAGVGTQKVHELFATIEALDGPCVVFIDEIDSLGVKRNPGANHSGVLQDQANTLNTFLQAMDGFKKRKHPIVFIGATNLAERLDPAFTRSGRFANQIKINPPKQAARKQLFQLYLSSIPNLAIQKTNPPTSLASLAHTLAISTAEGVTGADIQAICQTAIVKAELAEVDKVTQAHLEDAITDVLMGRKNTDIVLSPVEKIETAYHEAGHWAISWYHPDAIPARHISIEPRGHSLGHNAYRFGTESHSLSKANYQALICACLAGRAAEITLLKKQLHGASSDLAKAKQIAREMVMKLGMGDTPVFYKYDESLSQAKRQALEKEIEAILGAQNNEAKAMLKKHKADIQKMVDLLLEHGTLNYQQMVKAFGQPAAEKH